MPKLKILSSKNIVGILESFGFEVMGQKGSHIKLSRKTSIQKQVLTIPNNKELPRGTTKAIFNQISNFVSQEKLRNHFYIE
jgi:predicted RNA binding protein YcfA (HicA-like mRNA interferase family)